MINAPNYITDENIKRVFLLYMTIASNNFKNKTKETQCQQ